VSNSSARGDHGDRGGPSPSANDRAVMHRPATVKDVAKLAGVSPMTVSRTIAGGQNVRPQIQARVLEAVQTLGYHRNDNARRMRVSKGSGLIGVAITNLANPYYASFALGVEEVAAQHGARIIIGSTGEDAERERQLVADFLGRQVEGLVLVPAGGDSEHLQNHALGGTPLVLASRDLDGVDADTVLVDDVGGARAGTTALLEAGHRRIAYLGNVASVSTGHRRYEGFCRALDDYGVPLDGALVKRGQQDVEAAQVAMTALLELEDPPTAVFCANNRNTIGALKAIGAWIREPGVHPTAPAIVSFDDFELAELMPVPITVIDHDARQLGRESANLLFARMTPEGSRAATREIEMPTRLIVVRP
jgi:LacI family transcriptional regulator